MNSPLAIDLIDQFPAPRERRILPSGPMGWALIVAAATLPGLIALSFYYLNQTVSAQPFQWTYGLASTLPNWYLWALFAPAIIALARRTTAGVPGGLAAAVSMHIVLAIVLLGVHALMNLLLFRGVGLHDQVTASLYQVHFTSRMHANVLAYATIVGGWFAYDNYRSALLKERQNAALETQLTDAQLRALKMQLHPHFLFNALNSVAALVRTQRNTDAVRMLVRLSDFLRQAVDFQGGHEVRLEDEIDFVRAYLAVEEVRFSDRLTTLFDIDESALDALVPNLVLQPIVENAIHHGIAEQDAGRITISARRHESDLVLSVRDNGPGFVETTGGRRGVGLSNTKDRLRRLFGDQYKLTFLTPDDGGLEVLIRFPYHEQPLSLTTQSR